MPHPPVHKAIGTPFIDLQSVDSTNNYARQLINPVNLPEGQGKNMHGTAIFAHEQLAGKGQRGNTWISEKDSSIILSVVVDPNPLTVSQQFQLIACAAVSVYEFFSQLAGEDTKIKWPNDLYWQDKKAGGILIESVVHSNPNIKSVGNSGWDWAIIGIGINLNQTSFPTGLKNPVSLVQITGKPANPLEKTKELCVLLNKYFNLLISGGFETIYSKYLEHLYKKNELVRFKKDNRIFEAIVKTVTPSGQLVVEHGIEESVDFGNLEWLT